MARCKVIYLSIVLGLILILSVIPAFADLNDINETSSNPQTTDSTIGLLKSEITLNMNFLTSMLQMLDLNLNLISKTLDDHLEEYPFLAPTKEGADEGVKDVDSILAAFGVSPVSLNDTNLRYTKFFEHNFVTDRCFSPKPGWNDRRCEFNHGRI